MAVFALFGIMLAGVFIWAVTGRGVVVETNRLEGTVVSWSRSQDYTGSSSLYVTVKLADGRQVVATSSQSLAPNSGTRTLVQESVYESGARKFTWPVSPRNE